MRTKELEAINFKVKEGDHREIVIQREVGVLFVWMMIILSIWVLGCFYGVNWHEKLYGRIFQILGLSIFPLMIINGGLKKGLYKLTLTPDKIKITRSYGLFGFKKITILADQVTDICLESLETNSNAKSYIFLHLKDKSKQTIIDFKKSSISKEDAFKIRDEFSDILGINKKRPIIVDGR